MTSAFIDNLKPYSGYKTVVVSSTAIGKGPPAEINFKTLQAAPADAPRLVEVGEKLLLVSTCIAF